MTYAQRVFALVLIFVAGLTSALAEQGEELFPRPAALEPAVKFWTRVYTEVDTDRLMAAYNAAHPRA